MDRPALTHENNELWARWKKTHPNNPPTRADQEAVGELVDVVVCALPPGERITTSELIRRLHTAYEHQTTAARAIGMLRTAGRWPGAYETNEKVKVYGHPTYLWCRPPWAD
jgi:hypothetical protein